MFLLDKCRAVKLFSWGKLHLRLEVWLVLCIWPHVWFLIITVQGLKATSCYWITSNMSSIPQGALMAIKARQNNEKKLPFKDQNNFYSGRESPPLQYNSKMMNSIWGLYNRYSVHNLKKNINKNVAYTLVDPQEVPVGISAPVAKGTTSQRFTNWGQAWGLFGYTH